MVLDSRQEGGLELSVSKDADHGTLDWTEDGELVYVPDAGYLGEDSFSLTVTDGVTVKTIDYHYVVVAEGVDYSELENSFQPFWGQPIGGYPSDPGVPSGPEEPTQPAEPTDPVEPAQPAEPATPAQPGNPGIPATPAEPATPATPAHPAKPADPAKGKDEHTVPDKVETGGESTWWLAGAAALGAGALVTGRRVFGLR